ncbi:MAG: hypothetical protein JO363_03275 [Solirubrobacterales bacterium]|nr:hypothetical protein [Solirubrobacterales bacterium]
MPFVYGEWTLFDAIDALKAHDHGATDSGVSHPRLKAAVRDYLRSLDDAAFRAEVARVARRYLTDEAVARGYGIEDVVVLHDWLTEMIREY